MWRDFVHLVSMLREAQKRRDRGKDASECRELERGVDEVIKLILGSMHDGESAPALVAESADRRLPHNGAVA